MLPQDIQIPASGDFISVFGCEYSIDDDLVQEYVFQDDHKGELKLTFGLSDGSFGLSFSREGSRVLKIYDERLSSVVIKESDQVVLISVGDQFVSQEIRVVIWPMVDISIEYLRK